MSVDIKNAIRQLLEVIEDSEPPESREGYRENFHHGKELQKRLNVAIANRRRARRAPILQDAKILDLAPYLLKK